MNRYLLDTNILVYIISGEDYKIQRDILAVISDAYNICEVSSVSMIEVSQLLRKAKIKPRRGWEKENVLELLTNNLNIRILPFTERHVNTLLKLDAESGHNDPDDFAIVSHAITDRHTLVSSDEKFKYYTRQGLRFLYNKR